MSIKKLIAHGLMLVGILHMPFALYLGLTRGMGPEMTAFFSGLGFFWGGYVLKRAFGV
ncbi:MAG TPA: hypothetical protein V6D00_10690 [Pantanalinema sp.]